MFTDLTGVQYLAANENRMINELSACFKTSGVHYGPVDCTQYHVFIPCLPQNNRSIVVDAKDRTIKLLYKINVVNLNDSPVNNVCLILFNNHYNPLTSLSAWYGRHYYCIECEVRYNNKTLGNQFEYVLNAQRKTVCPFPHLPDVAKSVLERFAIVHVSEVKRCM